MLVLTRKKDEAIYIGDSIRVVVVQIYDTAKAVRLGLEAPRDVAILREELAGKVVKCTMCKGDRWFQIDGAPPVPCPGCNVSGESSITTTTSN